MSGQSAAMKSPTLRFGETVCGGVAPPPVSPPTAQGAGRRLRLTSCPHRLAWVASKPVKATPLRGGFASLDSFSSSLTVKRP